MGAMKDSRFRRWVLELWFQHKDEAISYHEQPKSPQFYFNTYKWWLKKEYKKNRE